MIEKVLQQHRQKPAFVYVRQSSMAQVRHHQESTERQYALKDKALQLGWTESAIRILDRDLGLSAAQMAGRDDFKVLIAEISMGNVGAVLALEASRLARSNADWHRLLQLCSLTNTLIIDEDGCYDLADFNDRLLLGLKGTMSEAELHFLRLRLLGGKLNKAKKGELRFPLPVGFSYDSRGRTVFDPDQQVQDAIRLLFATFQQTGSAYAVVNHFALHAISFPKRSYGGVWDGSLIWGRLTHGRVLAALKNPSYAGAYVYGRFRYRKHISPDGEIRSSIDSVPMSSWTVTIPDHHQAFITWQQFLLNQAILERNQTRASEQALLTGPAREGMSLLQGLLLCRKCGRRLTVSYRKTGSYECNWVRREGLGSHSCLHVGSGLLDQAVSRRLLEVIQPAKLQIALEAFNQLEQRELAITRQWQMQIERADYEAQLAQRRYQEVDPSNRLVAATLERQWNEALEELQRVRLTFSERSKTRLTATAHQRDQILALAQDLPRLWMAPTTSQKDRKRLLRLVVKDITVEKSLNLKQVLLHIRWQGGAVETLNVDLPPRISDRLRYSNDVIDRVRTLVTTLPDDQIAETLNREGVSSSKGNPFNPSMVKWIRYRYRLPAPPSKQHNELSVKQTAALLGVSSYVVYYWIGRGILPVRRLNQRSPYWITLTPEKEAELREWVRSSSRIRLTPAAHS